MSFVVSRLWSSLARPGRRGGRAPQASPEIAQIPPSGDESVVGRRHERLQVRPGQLGPVDVQQQSPEFCAIGQRITG